MEALEKPCDLCHHTDAHAGGGIGICMHEGCACDGPCVLDPATKHFLSQQVLRNMGRVNEVTTLVKSGADPDSDEFRADLLTILNTY